MGSGEKEFYSTIYALSSIAGEFTELTESDFAAANGLVYSPPENEGEFRRVNVARTIQLLKNSTIGYRTSHTNSNTKLRVPCGLISTNDALDGRPYVIWNSGTSNLSIENHLGTVLIALKPNQRCILFHTENNNWLVLFNAKDIPFDNTGTDLISTDVQAAIAELYNQVLTSASPGFGFGRSGAVARGAYLLCETVPSNITGRYVYINNAKITKVFVGNQIVGTYKYAIYYHDGDEVNLTLLGSVTVSAARGGTFDVSWSVPTGKYIAFRVATDSTDTPREIVAGLELTGTRAV